MIIMDFNQIALSSIFQFMGEISADKPEHSKNIIRHSLISSILYNKIKFSSDYGELVIASDGRNYWRKEKFPYYKASRKTTRDASGIDWKFIFGVIAEVREEIKQTFPYKVLNLDGIEADDIIAIICKWTQENYIDSNVIFPSPRKTLILSSDKDFKQLHRYSNIRQYSPAQKKYIESPSNVTHFINEHIARGDSSDGIPSILSDDDCFVNKVRQSPLVKKRIDEFLDLGIGACRTESEIRNWHRNELLISFDMIPEEIEQKVLAEFLVEKESSANSKIFKYFIKNNMSLFLNSIEDF